MHGLTRRTRGWRIGETIWDVPRKCTRGWRINRVTGDPRPRVSLLWHTTLPCVYPMIPPGRKPSINRPMMMPTDTRIRSPSPGTEHVTRFRSSFANARSIVENFHISSKNIYIYNLRLEKRKTWIKKEMESEGGIIGNGGRRCCTRLRIPFRG